MAMHRDTHFRDYKHDTAEQPTKRNVTRWSMYSHKRLQKPLTEAWDPRSLEPNHFLGCLSATYAVLYPIVFDRIVEVQETRHHHDISLPKPYPNNKHIRMRDHDAHRILVQAKNSNQIEIVWFHHLHKYIWSNSLDLLYASLGLRIVPSIQKQIRFFFEHAVFLFFSGSDQNLLLAKFQHRHSILWLLHNTVLVSPSIWFHHNDYARTINNEYIRCFALNRADDEYFNILRVWIELMRPLKFELFNPDARQKTASLVHRFVLVQQLWWTVNDSFSFAPKSGVNAHWVTHVFIIWNYI